MNDFVKQIPPKPEAIGMPSRYTIDWRIRWLELR
jgi:hypothetical protein